jgi:beta-galactosidase
MHRTFRTFVALAVLVMVALHAVEPAVTASEDRQVLSMDAGWRFHLGDIPVPPLKITQSADSAKAGNARGAAAHRYDDTAWRTVRLPHDWAVEGPFDPQANGDQGYRPRGFGWYRKTFQVPSAWRGQHVELHLDGIATHATVWVNGMRDAPEPQWLHRHGPRPDAGPHLG